MGGKIEREFKLRLPSEAALAALVRRLGVAPAPPVLQVNHFFDTSDRRLRDAHLAVRLREERGRFVLAVKGPELGESGALAARGEEELELDEPCARALLANARSIQDVLRERASPEHALLRTVLALGGPAPLRHVGAFENERVRVGPLRFPPGSEGPPLVFELDRTRFPDGSVERELEVELPEGARAEDVWSALRALFAELGVPPEPVPSKALRFFRAVDALERRA